MDFLVNAASKAIPCETYHAHDTRVATRETIQSEQYPAYTQTEFWC